ncbi:MAG: stage III sporulation protein AB [Clostridia bacterium]|nr:stage III sporulation protein AB [Clostridia bacterium]
MTVKILCGIVIVIACSTVGMKISNMMVQRVRSLGGFLSALAKMEGSIETVLMPLDEIYRELSGMKGKVGEFFSKLSPGCDWKKHLSFFPELTEQDKAIIVNMSEKLGEFESERQLKEIRLAQNLLEQALSGAKEEVAMNAKVYRSMSFFAGVVIAILLI